MDEILKKANDIGLMLKATPLFREFDSVSKEVETDSGASSLLKEYNEMAEYLGRKQSAGLDIEKYEIENFRELTRGVAECDLLMDYIKKRDAYLNLLMEIYTNIRAVNEDE